MTEVLRKLRIISIPKKGYYVSKYDISISKDDTIDSLESNIKKCKYDFSTKNIDSSIFPYYTWNKICKNIIYNDNILIKSDNFGHIETKTVIPIGIKAKIDTGKDIKIELLENCIS